MRKKFTMLFASLLACVGAAVAQVEEGKAYYLKVAGVEGYIDAKTGHNDTSGPTVAVSADPVMVYFKASTDGKWKISVNENLDGGFLKVSKWCANPNSTEEGQTDWSFVAVEGETDLYYFSQEYYQGNGDSNRTYLGNSSSVAIGTKLFTDQAVANAVKIQFVEVTQPAITVTYNFTYNGEVKFTQESTVASGANFPAISTVFPFGVTAAAKPEGTVTAENATQEIALSVNLPFAYAESYDAVEEGKYWYYLVFDSNNKFYLHHDAGQNHIDLGSKAVDKANKDIYSWGFVGNPFDGFQVVNRGAGSTMILSSSTTMSGTTDADTWPIMTATPVPSGNNSEWVLSTSSNATNGFFMEQKGYTSNKMNNRGKLAYWTGGAGAGSTFVVEARPFGPVAELEVLVEEAKTLQATVNDNIGTAIGNYSQATADALSAAITTAEGKGDTAVDDDVVALQAAMDAVKVILPTAGQYYQFHSAYQSFAEPRALYSNGSNARYMTLNDDDKRFYWLAEETADGGIVLKNASDSKYLHGNTDTSGNWTVDVEAGEGAEMDVKIMDDTDAENIVYAIILAGRHMHAANSDNGNATEANIVSWETNEVNSCSSWYIVPVELKKFYEVTYNFVYDGNVKYSTTVSVAENAAYPAVQVPVLPYGVTTDAATPEGNVTEAKTFEFALTVEKALPFVAAADVNSINTWYYAQMHANGLVTAYVQDNENESNNVEWQDKSVAANEIDSHLWGFAGDIWTGIKMVNKSTGRAIVSTSGAAVLGEAANVTAFFPTNSQAGGSWFCLKYPTNGNYLNAQGKQEEGKGHIAAWGDNDNGSSFKVTLFQEKAVSISDVDYSTLYLDYAVYIPEGVEVYAVSSIENGYVALSLVEGGVLPANTGVILKNAGEYTFQTAGATASVTSLLSGSATDTYVEGVAYVLANGSKGVGLYKAMLNKNEVGEAGTTHFKNNANKAYLVVPAEQASAPMFSFERGEGTTAIDNSQLTIHNSAIIYDLAGRRVEKMEKGIYIVNGRKVIR